MYYGKHTRTRAGVYHYAHACTHAGVTMMHMHACMQVCTMMNMYVWKSENNLWEFILSFHHVGPKVFLYPLSNLASLYKANHIEHVLFAW